MGKRAILSKLEVKNAKLFAGKIGSLKGNLQSLGRKRNAAEELSWKVADDLIVAIKLGDKKRISKLSKTLQAQIKKAEAYQLQVNRAAAQLGKMALLSDKAL